MVICPQCKMSDKVQKISAIHASGTVRSTSTDSYGQSISGTSQTPLAARFSPPLRRSGLFAWCFCTLFFGAIVGVTLITNTDKLTHGGYTRFAFAILHSLNQFIHTHISQAAFAFYSVFVVPGLLITLLLLPLGIKTTRRKRAEDDTRFSNWQRTWYCHRCDASFIS